jgi:hypothetical protein
VRFLRLRFATIQARSWPRDDREVVITSNVGCPLAQLWDCPRSASLSRRLELRPCCRTGRSETRGARTSVQRSARSISLLAPDPLPRLRRSRGITKQREASRTAAATPLPLGSPYLYLAVLPHFTNPSPPVRGRPSLHQRTTSGFGLLRYLRDSFSDQVRRGGSRDWKEVAKPMLRDGGVRGSSRRAALRTERQWH